MPVMVRKLGRNGWRGIGDRRKLQMSKIKKLIGPKEDSTEAELKEWILGQKIRYKDKRNKRLGNPVSYRILLKEQKSIIEDYSNNGLSIRLIGEKYHRPHTSISRLLKKNGYTVKSSQEASRKHFLNEDYFKVIDSEKKAYWLGWIFSDGSILKSGKEMRIKLQSRDLDVLEELKKDLEFTGNIKHGIAYKTKKETKIDKGFKKSEYPYPQRYRKRYFWQ